MTDDRGLLAELRQAAQPAAPANMRPGVVFDGQRPSQITTPPLPKMESSEEFEQAVRDLGYPLPDGYTLVLVEMVLVQHEAFWKRDPADKGQKDSAYTSPSSSFRYRFKVVPRSLRGGDMDLEAIAAAAAARPPVVLRESVGPVTMVACLADFQIGKTDERGGTAETLARSEAALVDFLESVEAGQPDEIVIVDPGDSMEGFESAPNAAQTNDLDLTEQFRVWRRILWRWVDACAALGIPMKVVSVPSNHCRVRRGKAAQGGTLDDWGIEAVSVIADILSANPEAYSHVECIIPQAHQEHVILTLAGGKTLGVVHGHQKGSTAALPGWIKSTGRRGLAQADIVIVGHFHHLVVMCFGDEQVLMVCPTNDNGSSWFTPSSGERSEPGVLTVTVDERRWSTSVIWLGDIRLD